jgi:TRAP-type uncharacterized transport system substrate-binding protein
VSVAFVQGGITDAAQSTELLSLGTVFYEPVWVFMRGDPPRQLAGLLKGRRVSIGPEGSGTHKLASELIGALGLDVTGTELLDLTSRDAGTALLRGEIDMAVMVAPWNLPWCASYLFPSASMRFPSRARMRTLRCVRT